MLSPGLKQTTHNTSQRTVKQSERLPILRRKMRCLPTLQHTTNPYCLRGDTQLKLSHPANHVRMPCQHKTHLNILRGKDRGTYPITNQSSKLHQQARYRLPDTINQTVQTLAQKL